MTQDSEYDLKPEEKPAVPAPDPVLPPAAGAPQNVPPAPTAPALPPGFVPPVPVILGPTDVDPDVADAEEHRVVAILGYLVFLLPLVTAPKSKFARYHANQGLLVFLSGVAVLVAIIMLLVVQEVTKAITVASIGTVLGYVVSCLAIPICVLFGIGVAGLALLGIINASNGEKKPLPVVGKMKLIK